MKSTWTLVPLLLALNAVSPLVTADEFTDAFNGYQQALNAGNRAGSLNFAQKAYELGATKFGKDSLDYANLGLNFAKELRRDKSPDFMKNCERATEIASTSLAIYEARVGNKAKELLDPLMVLGDVTENSKTAKGAYLRAIDIATASGDAELLALTRMDAFKRLSRTEFYNSSVLGYLEDAHGYFVANVPADSTLRLEATFLLAGAHLANRKFSKAEPLFLEVIEQYKVLDYSHPYALASHSRLVELYEKQGMSDKSTEHCIAIGSMKPWDDNQEQTPLFRKEPNYPIALAQRGKSGWTEVSFTVDEMGMVRDPKVLKSEGGKGFEKASLEALSTWRYAPKFENGKPVKGESRVKLEFTIQ